MKNTCKKGIALLLASVLSAALLTGCGTNVDNDIKSSPSTSEASTADDGTPTEIPSFSLKDMQGNTVTEAVFADKELTLVNVWATFCSPCINEMPDLESLSQEYKDKNVGFLGIVADGADAAPQAKELLSQLGISYTNLLPNDAFTQQFLSKQDAVPYTMVVDRTGKVLEYVLGAQSPKTFRQLIDKHLGQ